VTSVGPGHVVRVWNWNKAGLWPSWGHAGAGPRYISRVAVQVVVQVE
jgi:hypothetical protein